jgi:Flp pilus assembly protein TadD
MGKAWIYILLICVWIGGGAHNVRSQTISLKLHEMRFSVQGGQRIVSLHFSHPPDSFTSFVLPSPLRLVVDVRGAVEQRSAATYGVEDALVQRVRVGSHPGYTRFVLDLTGQDIPPFVVEQQESLVTAVLGEARGEPSEEIAQEHARVLFSLSKKALAARATPQVSPSPPPSRASVPVLKDALPPPSLPPEAQAHIERGQRFYDQGQVDEAIVEWRKTIRLAPKAAKAHHLLGVALRERGEQTKAIAAFREALRLEPDNATAYVHLARALEATGDAPGALEAYRAALQLVPSAPYVHNRLGHLLAAKGDWPEAAKEWQHTVHLAPDYAYAYVHLGDAFEHLNKKDDALGAYERALSMCSHFAEVLEKMGKKEQAAIFCREVRRSVTRLQGK